MSDCMSKYLVTFEGKSTNVGPSRPSSQEKGYVFAPRGTEGRE